MRIYGNRQQRVVLHCITISNTSLTFGYNITRHIHINNNSGTLIDSTLISNTLSDDLNILGNVDD